ncbi:MAG TPA: hypothetical protein VE621_06315 [Bryobacteraceae bacterium]|nr:hypothetical protein [Bryobacteraceae bacterium]
MVIRSLIAVFVCAVAFAEGPSSAVELPPELAQWRTDIEKTGNRSVVLARVFTDTARNEMYVAPDAPERAVIAAVLRSPAVAAQFVASHALNINLNGRTRQVSLILLNMARAHEWQPFEKAVLTHELGHVHLISSGYPSPNFSGCQATFIGDIVQHPLIRAEAERRGLSLDPYLQSKAEVDLQAMRNGTLSVKQLDACQRWAVLSLVTDVQQGLKNWPLRKEFEERFELLFPGILERATALAPLLDPSALIQKSLYLHALKRVAFEGTKPPQ